jgi:hypothetical protein
LQEVQFKRHIESSCHTFSYQNPIAVNAALLESIIAVNDEGQEYTLAQLSELGVSNPEIRRMELMTRLAGFDAYAKYLGHSAEFYTITAPSRFHAVKSDGKPNKKYTKKSPREAQAHLCKGWALSRAYLAKRGIKLYGFRVVEPHHDGTPHWHMVIFFERETDTQIVRETLKKYAMREDGDEFGADEHRFKAEKIDRSKGSAAGYLAKYISKNINAKGVEDDADFEGGQLGDNARRVDAWASCWGIRQFQQIGGAPVGVWRELRRLGEVVSEGMGGGVLQDLQRVADVGDWKGYTELMGGALVARVGMAARVRRVWFDNAVTRYDGEGVERVEGVEVEKGFLCTADGLYSNLGEFEKTRLREWVLKRAFTPAWSSVNNCNGEIKNERSNGEIEGSARGVERGGEGSKRGGDAPKSPKGRSGNRKGSLAISGGDMGNGRHVKTP